MIKQDYHVYVTSGEGRSLSIRKFEHPDEVGVQITQSGTSSSSGMSGEYSRYLINAEYFLSRDETIELVNALRKYFNIP